MRSSDGLAQCRLSRSDGRLSCKRLRQPVVSRGLRLIGGGKSLIGGVGGDFDDHDVALALQDGAEVSFDQRTDALGAGLDDLGGA